MHGRSPLMLLAALLAAATLAGCSDLPVTSAEPGSIEPGDDVFALTVAVVSLETAQPIAGALVTAGGAAGDATTGITDATGVARLVLAAPQVVALEAEAPGHVPAATYGIRLGDVPPDEVAGASVVACVFTLGIACPLDVSTTLRGEEGRLTLRMLPTVVVREVDVPVQPGYSTPASQTSTGTLLSFAADPDAARLYEDQLAGASAALTWTNAPGAAGDFEVALWCGAAVEPLGRSDGGGPETLATMGERKVELPPVPVGPRCGGLFVEVQIGSVSTQLTPRATVSLSFRPALQQPLAG